MSNAPLSCPHCHGPMSMPAGMEGRMVACPHCKQPFQLPGGEAFSAFAEDVSDGPPAFTADIPEGPRRRAPGKSPGANPLLWIGIVAVFGGALLVAIFLNKGSPMKGSLDKAHLRSLYNGIEPGTNADVARKKVLALLKEVPGDLTEKEPTGEEDGDFTLEFKKGDVEIALFISRATNQVVNKSKKGL